jgi:hypothetical protein
MEMKTGTGLLESYRIALRSIALPVTKEIVYSTLKQPLLTSEDEVRSAIDDIIAKGFSVYSSNMTDIKTKRSRPKKKLIAQNPGKHEILRNLRTIYTYSSGNLIFSK